MLPNEGCGSCQIEDESNGLLLTPNSSSMSKSAKDLDVMPPGCCGNLKLTIGSLHLLVPTGPPRAERWPSLLSSEITEAS